ncbi:MAG TPA: DNA polymerase III subunit gamma/tau [Firmicutes bacterium]|nr:DNA polymerase III subunit gamma/tau [Bacillota bacterium]
MYQALYRKYRPKVFSDVAGQEHITKVLSRQVEEERISHAYLFTGSRGTGKTTCAKILAKAINCLNPTNGQPCCECEMCRQIESEQQTDVVEIDAASNNSVENIRDLRSKIVYTPAAAKYRVYIIDEVHMLSTGAFNALLKTLEEPPEYVVFILATTEIHKLPATILSRCQRFDFRRLSPEIIAERVKYVCSSENLHITDDAAILIGRLADGALRDALSLLDVCAAKSDNIDEALVIGSAGIVGKEQMYKIAESFIARDTKKALETINLLYQSSHDMQRLCSELMSYYRDLMVAASVKDCGGLITASSSELGQIEHQAKAAGLNNIMQTMSVLKNTLESFRRSGASPLTQMEMAVVDICSKISYANDMQQYAVASSAAGQGTRTAASANNVQDSGAVNGATGAEHGEQGAKRQNIWPGTAAQNVGADDRPPWISADEAAEFNAQPQNKGADLAISNDGGVAGQNMDSGVKASGGDTGAENKSAACGYSGDIPFPDDSDAPPDTSGAGSIDMSGVVSHNEQTANPPLPDGVEVCAKWPEVMDALASKNRAMYAVLMGSKAYIKGDLLLIDAKNSLFRDMIKTETRHRSDIRAAAEKVLGVKYRLGPFNAASSASTSASDPLDKLSGKLKQAGFDVK